MIPDNIVWAFFSNTEYIHQLDVAAAARDTVNKLMDTYYKDFNGKWVRVTAVFDCIEKARKGYKMKDAQYFGAVLVNTKTEVPRGSVFPPVEKSDLEKSVEKMRALDTMIEIKKKRVPEFDEYDDFLKRRYRTYYNDTW